MVLIGFLRQFLPAFLKDGGRGEEGAEKMKQISIFSKDVIETNDKACSESQLLGSQRVSLSVPILLSYFFLSE